jgi:hypothetical protein
MVEIFSLIDSYAGEKKIGINTVDELEMEINKIHSNFESKVIILQSENLGELVIGVGKVYGFIEFIGKSGELPYLHLVDKHPKECEYYEFDSGGTPTPIPSINCLPISQIIDIAVYFFTYKMLPQNINWQEI